MASHHLFEFYKKRYRSGDYLDYAVEYFRANLKTFFKMTLVFHVPVTFITFFLMDYGNLFGMLMDYTMTEGYDAFFLKIILIYLGILAYSIYSSTVVHSISLGTIKNTYEYIVNGNKMTFKQSLIYGFKRLLWYVLFLFLLGTVSGGLIYVFYFLIIINVLGYVVAGSVVISVLLGIITGLLCLAFIVALIYLYLRVYFVPHFISIERVNCFQALKLSWMITAKKVRYIIWPVFFGAMFVELIPSAVTSVLPYLPITDPLVTRIVTAALLAAAALLFPFMYIYTTQIFIYLKNEKGLFDFNRKLNALIADESERITFGRTDGVVN